MTSQWLTEKSRWKHHRAQRLTPVAWLLIGVLSSSAACGILSGPVEPTVEQVADMPTSAVVPTDEPTEAVPTDTVEPTEAGDPFPAWWADEMTQDEDGNWWPPDEVKEMVEEVWHVNLDVARQYLVETKPPDYDAYEEFWYEWSMGEELEGALNVLERERAGEEPIAISEWNLCLFLAYDFTPDGLECTLSVACQNGIRRTYDPKTGDLLSEEPRDHMGVAIIRMRYDPTNGHWKRSEFLEYIPPIEQ